MDYELLSLMRVGKLTSLEGIDGEVMERSISPEQLSYPNIRKVYDLLVQVKHKHPEVIGYLFKNRVTVGLMKKEEFSKLLTIPIYAKVKSAGAILRGFGSCKTPDKTIYLNPEVMGSGEMEGIFYHEYSHCVESIERIRKGLGEMTGEWKLTNGITPVGQERRAEHYRVRAMGFPPKRF